MKIIKTKFKDLIIIQSKEHLDKRGSFRELFRENFLKKEKFPFVCVSSSIKNVLRGMHIQYKFSQAKLVSALEGRIFDVAVDLRKNSKTFGQYFSLELSKNNGLSIFIPKGFAHGFVGLDKKNTILYLLSNYRHKNFEKGIMWNDKDLKINWPVNKPKISNKDKKNISLKEYLEKYV